MSDISAELITFHPIRVRPRWTGGAGSSVIIVEAGVTGGAGLAIAT